MPRLDAARVRAWRDLQSIVPEIERRIDEDLRAEWAVPLGWFDVLAALRELDGRARPQDVAIGDADPGLEPQPPARPAGGGRLGAPPPRRRPRRPPRGRGRAHATRPRPVAGDERQLPAFAAGPLRHRTDRPRHPGADGDSAHLSDHTADRAPPPSGADTGRARTLRRTSLRSRWRSGRGCRAA